MTEAQDHDGEGRKQQAAPQPYVPPKAEDIDTRHEPAETVAGFQSTPPGVEESERWH